MTTPAISLPSVPVPHRDFMKYVKANPATPMLELVKPFKEFDSRMRELYAQQPDHSAVRDPLVNIVPVFDENTSDIKVRARNLEAETEAERDRYIMPLSDDVRKSSGSPAVVQSLDEFRHNFGVFTESSLSDLDFSNVVVAGSAVITSLLPVPEEFRESRRALREYYHRRVAPASDVDLFLYGLTEDEAIEKIKQIETKVRDSILEETTTIRTKNAITIASQYPTRHIQIVLRIYKSISEILTGFDVDCSCAAYDGKQVYAAPRALAAYMTQANHIDLTRRSPSYENRLSKYSHRGFEVYWPQLDRSRIDPTIFERSFQRTLGLARLLVLEKLPKPEDRDNYMDQRRAERGRPPLNRWTRFQKLKGNIKNDHEDEVNDWVEADEVSNYHTFTIPYGEKFTAKRIEKLLYTKDLLLNAEWNKPKDRDVNLHRHPAFFGAVEEVIDDCCGFCPKPITAEEQEASEEESKIYVSGKLTFIKDDPGRQAIGSFNPLTDDDWTEQSYIGNTARLCQAIIDDDLEHVQDWLGQEGVDVNRRDYTGRTPLHLATMCSTPRVVKALVDHNARLVARLADGRTALHIAAARGDVEMVKILMDRSESNEAEWEEKEQLRKAVKSSTNHQSATQQTKENEATDDSGDSDAEMIDADDDSVADGRSTGSFVSVRTNDKDKQVGDNMPDEAADDEPDFYAVDGVAWDRPASALHFAIVNGHVEVVRQLCSDYGADVLLPIKLSHPHQQGASAAILTLVLALTLPPEQSEAMTKVLLDLGATSAQADRDGVTAFHYYVKNSTEAMKVLMKLDPVAVKSAVNHLSLTGGQWNPTLSTPLLSAIESGDPERVRELLAAAAKPQVEFSPWSKAAKSAFGDNYNLGADQDRKRFKESTKQPLIQAVEHDGPMIALQLIEAGVDVNTLTPTGNKVLGDDYSRNYNKGETVLDLVQDKLKELRGYSGEKVQYGHVERPIPLKDDSEYLEGLAEGSYQHWYAKQELQDARNCYENDLKKYARQKLASRNRKGIQAKQQFIRDLIAEFEKLESVLIEKGARTFKDLYPDIKCSENQRFNNHWTPPKPKPFELRFLMQDQSEMEKGGYIALFEAAWIGDVEGIRRLVSEPRGTEKDEPPLEIARADKTGMTPFAIALMRGYGEAAESILDIAQVQYQPEEKKENRRYRIAGRHEEEESEDEGQSDDDVEIESLVIDEQFTIENVGEVSLQVRSKTPPTQLLTRYYPMGKLGGEGNTLFTHAIHKDDLNLFNTLVELGKKHLDQENEKPSLEQNSTRRYIFTTAQDGDLNLALKLGRTRFLEVMLSRGTAGASLPLEDLVKKSGVEVKETPKYYQGLNVHGRKRTDWAQAGRNVRSDQTANQTSLLLQSAQEGSIDSLIWLLSDAPMRQYLAFAQRHSDDDRVRHLNEIPGGFEKAVASWLGTRMDLLLHMAVLCNSPEKGEDLIRYVVKTFPHMLEKKSITGHSPLHLAFSLRRVNYAKLLIEAGAKINTKDHDFNNLLHTMLVPIDKSKNTKLENIRDLLDLIPEQQRQDMFTDRNGYATGGGTPIHYWLNHTNLAPGRNNYGGHMHQGSDEELEKENRQKAKVLAVLLSYSKGQELNMVDGAGETPLHSVVLFWNAPLAGEILKINPDLLGRENATGRTPAEIAAEQVVSTSFPTTNEYHGWSQSSNLWRSRRHMRQFGSTKTVDLAPEEFAKSKGGTKLLTPREKLHALCQEYAARLPGRRPVRRLVSLNEANEVARRLAEVQKQKRREAEAAKLREAENSNLSRQERRELRWRSRYGGIDETVNEGTDEVSAWYSRASNVSWGTGGDDDSSEEIAKAKNDERELNEEVDRLRGEVGGLQIRERGRKRPSDAGLDVEDQDTAGARSPSKRRVLEDEYLRLGDSP